MQQEHRHDYIIRWREYILFYLYFSVLSVTLHKTLVVTGEVTSTLTGRCQRCGAFMWTHTTRKVLPDTRQVMTSAKCLLIFSGTWVTSSQYHLIMMSSRVRFVMRPTDWTSVWFSSVLGARDGGAMSWKAIRSIKRSTGMARAAMVCSSPAPRDKESDKGNEGKRFRQIESTLAWQSHTVEPGSGHLSTKTTLVCILVFI